MTDLYIILFVLGCGLSLWWLYRLIRHQPHTFSSKNFFKTLTTLGFVALGLIAIIGISIISLKG